MRSGQHRVQAWPDEDLKTSFGNSGELDALHRALRDAAMTRDVGAATFIVRIIGARVRLNGLEPVGYGLGGRGQTPRTLVVPTTA